MAKHIEINPCKLQNGFNVGLFDGEEIINCVFPIAGVFEFDGTPFNPDKLFEEVAYGHS